MTLFSDSFDTYASTVQSSPSSDSATLPPHPRLQTSYPPSSHSVTSLSAPSPSSLAPGCPSMPPASSPPDSLKILQWNAGGLQARNTELLHFLLSHPADLICIQEFNLNSSSSFQIPGFSALCSDHTHSRSDILSPDAIHASSSVIIFVRQGLSFSELSTSFLSSLNPYSEYVGVDISPNNSSLLSFLNVYAPPICSSLMHSRSDFFSSSIFSSINLFWGTSIAMTLSGTQEVLAIPTGRRYSTGSSLLTSFPLNDLDTPTLLHCSTGSCSSPDISFAPSFAFSCSCEVLQDLGSDHLPILLSVSPFGLSPHRVSFFLQFSESLLG